MNNSGCEHMCENTRGSFACTCLPGYELGSNEQICNGGLPKFLLAIKFLSLLLLLQYRSTHSDTIDTGYCSSSNSRI